ncbi:MAG: tRNA lysidine(34) synthetase TilS [Treponema sp.]|nr:tRNA lysidine(34) synthetase TilS [Treponema sp.]
MSVRKVGYFTDFFEGAVHTALGRLPQDTVLLAAVSGGADSMAMLTALAAIQPESGFILNVLHVEHGMRPAAESRADAAAVKKYCRELGIKCRVIAIAPGLIEQTGRERGMGPEAAARFFRLRALNREACRLQAGGLLAGKQQTCKMQTGGQNAAVRILTAHTKDDNVETILMRILRGSGPAGLAGIKREKGLYLRPLLNLTRSDVLDYLKIKNISYRTDSTNFDTRFLRNRIRKFLIPVLDQGFPYWRDNLLNFAETQALAADFISREASKKLHWKSGQMPGGSPGKSLQTDSAAFFTEHPVLQEEAVFNAADWLAGHKNAVKNSAVMRDPAAARRVPGRKNLRNLLAGLKTGKVNAGDLGPVRLAEKNGFFYVTGAGLRSFDSDFSMLIDTPGLYNYKKLRIIVRTKEGFPAGKAVPVCDAVPADRTVPAAGGNFFYAGLPLVLKKWSAADTIIKAGHKYLLSDIFKSGERAGFYGLVTALDSSGNAAFFGTGQSGDVFFCRQETPRTGDCVFFILTGVTDE